MTQPVANAAKTATGAVPDVTVRVEGLTKTLLLPTAVTLESGLVNKGVAADSCSGLSALGALQDATHGAWGGSWSSSYKDYFVTSILGDGYSATADYYWAFWLNDKPASLGACSVDPAKGSSVLFFPEYDGKSKSVIAPNVLGISAPASALAGKPFSVDVTSYANATGKASPAAGARVSAASASATAGSSGKVSLEISKTGNVEIKVTAANSLRDETTVCIHKSGASCSS
ncbi:MAG TPA: DUF4430 domain-containing protein [Solirubrobacteraceae bacterium]|nr:DUF4430 domain-containing protein [Solirubrobacteraceae bacterium]